jgi:hypothetical protein
VADGEMHVLCSGHGAESGLFRFNKATGPIRVTLRGRETLLVPKGARRASRLTTDRCWS